MTPEQHLFGKLAEEATEVAHIALKIQQFGLQDTKPGQDLTNKQRLYQELNDMFAIVDMLNARTPFRYVPNQAALRAKIEKVDRYAALSINLGFIDEPD